MKLFSQLFIGGIVQIYHRQKLRLIIVVIVARVRVVRHVWDETSEPAVGRYLNLAVNGSVRPVR